MYSLLLGWAGNVKWREGCRTLSDSLKGFEPIPLFLALPLLPFMWDLRFYRFLSFSGVVGENWAVSLLLPTACLD